MKRYFPLISARTAFHAFGAASVLALAVRPVWADTYAVCVTDAQELQEALTAGSDGGMESGNDIEISLAQGTYKTGSMTGNGPFKFTSTATTGSLEIRGGYGPNCTDFTGSTSRAKLDGGGNTQVLNIRSENASVYLRGFTIQNGNAADNGGGLNINYGKSTSPTQTTNVFWTVIKDNQSQAQGGGFAISADGDSNGLINLDSNIVIGNSSSANYGAGIIQSNAGGISYVTHDTIYNNSTAQEAGTGGLFIDALGAANVSVVDSIFSSNTNIGLFLSGFNISLDYCDYGKLGGDAPVNNFGPLSVGPQFVDAANENFHLASGSPLIGATKTTFGIDDDPEGHPYANRGDMGTFAETIFTDDFEVSTP
jgi:hypothetical protein